MSSMIDFSITIFDVLDMNVKYFMRLN